MEKFLEQIRALDPNDPGRWPLPFRLGAVGLIFVVAVGICAYLIAIKDQKPKLEQARAEEQSLTTTLESKSRKAANLDAYKEQLKEMERSFGAMLRQLPNKTEVPNLLVDISQTGLAAGLEEKLFQPTGEVKKDFYAELPIRIRLTGSYHAVGNFVSGIASLPRIVTLHGMQLSQSTAKGATTDQLQLDITAKTYRYLDDEEQAAVAEQERNSKKAAKN